MINKQEINKAIIEELERMISFRELQLRNKPVTAKDFGNCSVSEWYDKFYNADPEYKALTAALEKYKSKKKDIDIKVNVSVNDWINAFVKQLDKVEITMPKAFIRLNECRNGEEVETKIPVEYQYGE